MKFSTSLAVLLSAILQSVIAAPTTPSKTIEARSISQCGQYSSIASGAYTLYSNEWGASTSGTTGSQCSYITGLQNGNSLQWYTTWTWANNPTQVKSYTNAEVSIPQKAINAYKSIATTWQWSYTGTSLNCNGKLSPSSLGSNIRRYHSITSIPLKHLP